MNLITGIIEISMRLANEKLDEVEELERIAKKAINDNKELFNELARC